MSFNRWKHSGKKGQVSLPSFQRIQYVDRICNFLQAISHQTAIFSELTISQNFHTELFKLYMLSISLRFLKPHEQNHVESSEFNQIQIWIIIHIPCRRLNQFSTQNPQKVWYRKQTEFFKGIYKGIKTNGYML